LATEAERWFVREGIPPVERSITYNVDMRYYRQGYEIPIPIDLDELASAGPSVLIHRFHHVHQQLYGFKMPDAPCEIVNLRAVGVGVVPKPHLSEFAEAGPDASPAVIDEHDVYFRGGWLPTKVYDRLKLAPGNRLMGPAIVVEFDSTTVVLPGYAARVDRFGNLLITPMAS
jgi:N-methylhydantoinase A